MTIGAKATITGANFGDPNATGFSLGIQVGTAPLVPVAQPIWLPASISFTVPTAPGLVAGALFTVGIVRDAAFIAKTELRLCAAAPALLQKSKTGPPVIQPTQLPVAAPQTITETPTVYPPSIRKSPGATLPLTSQPFAPKITSVTPSPCVQAGKKAALGWSGLGSAKPEGASLVVKPKGGAATTVADASWSPAGVSFTVPAWFAAGSTFTAEVFSGGAAVVSASLAVCPAVRSRKKPATRTAVKRVAPAAFKPRRLPPERAFGPGMKPGGGDSGNQPADAGWPPEITSVSPPDCVDAGVWATASGVNLGASKQSAGFSLAIQVDDGKPIPAADKDWSPTSIAFLVPQEAEAAGWFALGIDFESDFYPQQYVWLCSAYWGEQDYGYEYEYDGYDYGGQDYGDGQYFGDYQGAGGGAGPKGARVLGPGGIDIQIEPSPPPAEPAPEPAAAGKRAVGGKLLAMKALAKRGLNKVNRECDLFDLHCPCCRKDDSVCLEKQSDNEDGSSTWVVRWQEGAKPVDGQGLYNGRSAEDDLEAVTGLRCEPAAGATAVGAGVATLACR